ncbi:DBH-like monooxygenase protein 1 [Portunus trituberculatus]|uniref:DBH-like monooxygenase protein 1 n=1 Tax=Portunus trituberculatus TaxID=210409 RepID=A0A5B7EB38_PORTR|nr:DBH-like monooxygenase protein 1 [Portunus trituberculatus]
MTYDFNYQSSRVFKEEVMLLPGDTLITECYYNSSHNTKPTTGGLTTKEEMCLAFLSYYPRTKLFSCLSEPKFEDIMTTVGVTDVEHTMMRKTTSEQPEENMTEGKKDRSTTQELQDIKFSDYYHTVRIKAPEEYLNLSMHDILFDDAMWQDPMTADAFQRLATSGVHKVNCGINGQNGLEEKVKLVPYPSYRSRRHRQDRCTKLSGKSSVYTPVLSQS